jgi:hypothetical protein
VGWSSACKDVSPEEEKRPPLEAVTDNVTENSRGSSLKSGSGQLSGVGSEAAPARTEAAEHGS